MRAWREIDARGVVCLMEPCVVFGHFLAVTSCVSGTAMGASVVIDSGTEMLCNRRVVGTHRE